MSRFYVFNVLRYFLNVFFTTMVYHTGKRDATKLHRSCFLSHCYKYKLFSCCSLFYSILCCRACASTLRPDRGVSKWSICHAARRPSLCLGHPLTTKRRSRRPSLIAFAASISVCVRRTVCYERREKCEEQERPAVAAHTARCCLCLRPCFRVTSHVTRGDLFRPTFPDVAGLRRANSLS